MELDKPMSLEEIKKLKKPVREYYKKRRAVYKWHERLAIWFTERIGGIGFLFVIVAWTFLWIGWNALAPVELRFDPFPTFFVWTFVSSMLQLFFMPLILISQNIQDKEFESRADADLQVNIISEREIENILLHLEHQNALMLKILKKLEKESEKK